MNGPNRSLLLLINGEVKVFVLLPLPFYYVHPSFQDPVNGPKYLYNSSYSLSVASDFVQVTGDLFHHTLAWLEADPASMVDNATTLMSTTETIAFFPMQVGRRPKRA